MSSQVIIDRHLYLTADKQKLVDEGDQRAAFLWATPGWQVNAEEAERLGYQPLASLPAEEPIVAEEVPAEDPEQAEAPAEEAETKQVEAPENKMIAPPENKRAKGRRA